MQRASVVRWYEPNITARRRIERAFGGLFEFDPAQLPGDGQDFVANVAATASAFLTFASGASLLDGAPFSLQDELKEARRPVSVGFKLAPPAIVHARLVERFGRAADERVALKIARREDLAAWPPRAVRDHLRWAVSRSLYEDDGVLRRVTGLIARHPGILRHLPARVTAFIYDKGPAVLLPNGEYEVVYALASGALNNSARTSPLQRGSDLYYLAHSLRYMSAPEQARRTLGHAQALLVDRRGSDAERYAGVLLEAGLIAIHQGRVADAFIAANDLVNGPGRYAIGRWSGWGHWLWALAHLYSAGVPNLGSSVDHAVLAAAEHIDHAKADFDDSGLERGMGDLLVLQLLSHRLRIAAGHNDFVPSTEVPLTRRQSHDVALLLADIALGRDELAEADQHLSLVERSPANRVAAAWAQLGRAAYADRVGVPGPAYAEIERDASQAGAWWLAAQARLATEHTNEVTIDAGPWPVRAAPVGDPRVLWLLT
jgi:hypothetical protein